jgi:transposase-like protein
MIWAVQESFEPDRTVSMVARQHDVNPNQLFHWRKLYQDGSLSAATAGEEADSPRAFRQQIRIEETSLASYHGRTCIVYFAPAGIPGRGTQRYEEPA